MRHWKESLVSAILVILMLSLSPAAADDYDWNKGYDYWSDAAHWTPAGGPPVSGDRAFIGTLTTNPTVYLTQNASASYLSLQNGAWLRTSGYTMQVWGNTYLNKTTSSSVQLFVNSGAIGDDDFDTDLLSITGGAELDMEGGVAEIDDQINVDANSYITGYGTINFRTNHAQALNLRGTLITDTGTLTLKVIGGYTGKIDLDGLGIGAGHSTINVTSGTSSLVIDGPVADAFDGTMTIGEGNSVNFTHAWTHSGTLNFNGASGIATLSGAAVTVNQAINANSGIGRITADVVFNPGTTVTVAVGAELRLSGQTTYQGSSYTGAGILVQDGDAIIAADTTIDTAYYDWDGSWGTSHTTVNSGKTFTINSTITDVRDGIVTVNGGTLVVNSPWTMRGTMNINSATVWGELQGSEMTLDSVGTLNLNSATVYAPLIVEGTVNVNHLGWFYGATVFESTASVNIPSGWLVLDGPTTFRGGSYTGAGTLYQYADVVVEDNTTIDVATYDWDSNYTTTIDPGVTFRINSTTINKDVGKNDFGGTLNINGGTLHVDTTDPWRMEGTMNLNNTGIIPKVYGTEMIVRDSVALGEGINVTGGIAYIYSPVTFESTAVVNVASGATLRLYGATIYQGGSYTGDGTLLQDGSATIEADTTINTAVFDWDGNSPFSYTTINSGVTFTIDSSIIDDFPSDGFDGTVNINGGTLTVNTTDPWRMEGTMNLNSTVGTPRVYGTEMIVCDSLALGEGINVTGGSAYIYSPVTFESSAKVNVASGAELQIFGATIYRGGSYTGDGTLGQDGSATIEADTTIDTAVFDWDGGVPLSYTTINSGKTFTINSTKIDYITDGFDGTVNVNGGTLRVYTTDPWRMEGTMNLNNTGSVPRVFGTEMIVCDSVALGEGINVTGGSNSIIYCPVTFESTASVNVAGGSGLILSGTSTTKTFKGGSYTGDGRISMQCNVNVEADTTIDVANIDLHNQSSPVCTTTIDPNVTFTINSVIDDYHTGIININGGKFVANSPGGWTVGALGATINVDDATAWGELHGTEMTLHSNGTLNLSCGAVYAPIIVEGTVNANNFGWFYGATVFESTANVSIPLGYLVLEGPTTFRDGSYTGAGILYQYADAVVEANTTIDVGTYDWNYTTTINPGVTFTINSNSIQSSTNNYFAGTVNVNGGATLAVNTTDPWELRGQMNLAGGQVTGSSIINEGTISGYGTIAADHLVNNGTLSADGGTLVLGTTVFPDLDGSLPDETGVIEALTGDVHVMGDFGSLFNFSGQLYVGAGQEFRMDHQGLLNLGLMNLQGGTYVAPEFAHWATLTIGTAPSTLQSSSTFQSSSTTTLDADLLIDGDATFKAGATVTGTGTLVIMPGSKLMGDGNIGVDVMNQGSFKPGLSVGTFYIAGDYEQTSGGGLEIEIGGLIPGSQHDQVVVTGSATLAGGLALPLDGYEPDYYDKFEILTAGAVIGIFDWIKGVDAFPKKYLAVIYNADNVTVVAAIPGDADIDADVDAADYGAWQAGFGATTGGTWVTGDFDGDGDVDAADYGTWQAFFGSTVPGGTNVPEPTTLLLLCGAAVPVMLKRRRKS